MASQDDRDLGKTSANYQPLTPLTFLARAASVYHDHIAVVHGNSNFTYKQFYQRCRQLGSALAKAGIGKNDTVSVMLANTPPMLEAHYGVAMCGAVVNTMNTRLDAKVIAFLLDHAETKVLIVDKEFSIVVKEALSLTQTARPIIIDYDDPEFDITGERLGQVEYEDFIAGGDPEFDWVRPDDEWDAISLNYTSGTTGNPKGVVYHHRGAYLVAQGNASNPLALFYANQSDPPTEVVKQVIPLDWDQTHTVNVNLSLAEPRKWGVSILTKYSSGFPYTPTYQGSSLDSPNSDRKPDYFNVDINMHKDVIFAGLHWTVFAKIYNALNTQNERSVFSDTGRATYSLIPIYTPDNGHIAGRHSLSDYLTRPSYFSSPRQFRLGISTSF
ncbi:MAG: AMP-binding protein [Candidatus Marinimicrobia bacterium]|nr:AMP-binding protein [Candidatus Neomarinimicrobiota bacterium]